MAIKYNWKDLVKRIINGREVEKVIYNGNQIWPESTPTFDNYLQFEARRDYSSVGLDYYSNSEPTIQLEYSFDKINWNDYSWSLNEYDYYSWLVINLRNWYDTVYFRNKSATVTPFRNFRFVSSGLLRAYGDVTSLLCRYGSLTMPQWCSFESLFEYNRISAAPQLPATVLEQPYCYQYMFRGTPIATAPQLPATTLSNYCYIGMFEWCYNLAAAPQLPATTLTDYCYQWMFENCTSLTTASSLPATTLTEGCYSFMFKNCTSLTTLPSLPATTLAYECYARMFESCTNIKLSDQQVGDYQTPYRIPTSWSWTDATDSMRGMFDYTWGTFTWTPSINTTYYTSNTVI